MGPTALGWVIKQDPSANKKSIIAVDSDLNDGFKDTNKFQIEGSAQEDSDHKEPK
jgi:hypothetical protein